MIKKGFYKYLAAKERTWKYQELAGAMRQIVSEDECNDTYGRIRMYQMLLLKQPEGIHISWERTVYFVSGMAMDTNMKASLCRQTLDHAVRFCLALREQSYAGLGFRQRRQM